jgi:hypothetical protein
MNRAQVSHSLNDFYDRLACAQLGDVDKLLCVRSDLEKYISALEESYEEIDGYTLGDLVRVYSYFYYNKPFILKIDGLEQTFLSIEAVIEKHKLFLVENGLLSQRIEGWYLKQGV